jgi:hypothetical protein
VYGGGGNSGAELRNDFIELRNLEPFDVSVTGWSVQYSSAAGSSWSATVLNGIIPSGGYYLVQGAAGAGGVISLPRPDAIGTLALAAASGKVALVTGPAILSGTCPTAGVLDIVGYGAANCFEGTGAAPTLSNTLAAVRLDGGLVDTNENAADFVAAVPSPKSTAGVPPTGVGAASPASVPSGSTTLLTIRAVPGAFPPAPIAEVTVDLSSMGGSSERMFDDGTHGDVLGGDGVYSLQIVVSGDPGFAVVTGALRDIRGRSSVTPIRLAVETTTTVAIASIQGSGSTSPLDGQFVTLAGVVTAVRSSGFYVQTPDGEHDGDAATSEGIFVFSGATPRPSVGDAVRVSGLVAEFAPAPRSPPVTEIAGRPVFTIAGTGLALPEAVRLGPADTSPGGSIEQLESVEGMRVHADLSVTAPTEGTVFESSATAASNGVFYAVILGLPRPVREPGLEPGAPAPPGLPCCVPRFDGNPERLRIDSGAQLESARLEVAAGQRVLGITGVLDFAFGSYTLLPDPGAGTVVGAQQATPVPSPAAGEFTVASANLERFFDEQDDPERDDPVLTSEAVERRLQKASLAVRRVLRSPDVLAVLEIENLAVLQRLATRINADAVADGEADPMYAAYLEEGNDVGGIDSGFLVKLARVDVIGVEQIGKDATYSPPGLAGGNPLPLLNDRPPLVLMAAVRGDQATAVPVTVIVNHLRSLSGIDGRDGERVRAKRRAQAEFLALLIQSRQGTERVIAVGDFNAFPFNDGLVDVLGTIKGQPTSPDQVVLPSADLVEPDLTNLGDALGPAEQYSFVFRGNAQALDHILVNSLALQLVTRTAYARSNADFPESLRGDASRPERLSDHDAVIAYFTFPDAPVVALLGAPEMEVEAYTSFQDPGATAHDRHTALPVTTTGVVDVNSPGDYILTYTASRWDLTTTATRVVRVRDTVAPRIAGFRLTPDILVPPNHRLVDVRASYGVSDAGNRASCALAVTSNEPTNGRGDGNTPIDWIIHDPEHLQLRAERSLRGNGRTYRVVVTCRDQAGNSAQAAARVAVAR